MSNRLRAQGDSHLTREILEDSWVKQSIRRMSDSEMPLRIRRQLLATAVRLTPAMAPGLLDLIIACRNELGVDIPMEMYVYPSPLFNAMCIKPEEGRLFVALSSSLLDHFTATELKFVLGHELGHYLFQHHEVPVGSLLNSDPPPDPGMMLKLFAWSRYAEISADRAGAVCSRDLDAIARAMFKLASGLTGKMVEPSMNEMLHQLDDMRLEDRAMVRRGGPSPDWFSTHPFSPLRLQALVYTFDSEILRPEGDSIDTLEEKIEPLMGLMKPSYLDDRSHEAEVMRRVLFAAAVVVADAHRGISEEEVRAIEGFFGHGAITPSMDLHRLKADLNARLDEAVRYVPPARRAQVFRDIVVVIFADKEVHPAEKGQLEEIARRLEIPAATVQSLMEPRIEQHR